MAGLKADLDSYLNSSKSTPSSSGVNISKLTSSLFSFRSPVLRSEADGDSDALLSSMEEGGSSVDDSSKSSSWLSSMMPSMSKSQRFSIFLLLAALSAICFVMSFFLLPVLALQARKFSLLFSLGSLLAILAMAVLMNSNPISLLCSLNGPSFGAVYLTSLLLTIYAAASLQSTLLAALAGAIQVGALITFVISLFPGGRTALTMMTKFVCRGSVTKVLPI